MQNNTTSINNKKTKIFLLVFLCLLAFYQCKTEKKEEVTMVYKNEKAVSVHFYIENSNKDDISFFIQDNYRNAIVGNLTQEDNSYTFTPILPFSSGQYYQLHYKGQIYKEFVIEDFYSTKKPKVLAVYPSKDTVPENLLKMYFVFSEPMQQVNSALNYITVTHKESGDVKDIFLELDPELWNKDHTRLTLWLDPGRIKQGLIPNREKGIPIIENNTYELKIDTEWKTATGVVLDKEYTKTFYVAKRDKLKPNAAQWNVLTPQNNTKEPLIIEFNESLDAILAKEVFQIRTENNEQIQGVFTLNKNEDTLEFLPQNPWNIGKYHITIEERLEDLAGNNMARLFDTDIKKNVSNDTPILQILFRIK